MFMRSEWIVAHTCVKVLIVRLEVVTLAEPRVTIEIVLFNNAERSTSPLMLASGWAESPLVVPLVLVPLKGYNLFPDCHVEQF